MHPQRACLLPKSHLVYLFQSDSFWSYEVRRLRVSRFGRLAPITHIPLSYQTAMEKSRQLCLSLRFGGKLSGKKSYKVAGVTEGFDAGLSQEEMANHGRWKSSDTLKIYYAQSVKWKIDIFNISRTFTSLKSRLIKMYVITWVFSQFGNKGKTQ